MSGIRYATLVGTGNDFVLVDGREGGAPSAGGWARLAKRLCSSKGTDGLLVLASSRRADVRMRIFNPDGSEPAMCGNGIRCLAWFAHRAGAAGRTMTIETGAGLKRATIRGPKRVRVDMGTPAFRKQLVGLFNDRGIPADADLIDTGVPHLVCWVGNPARIDVEKAGRVLRRHPRLGRAGANVDFVRVARAGRGRATLEMRTYERGVEAETQACGTGSVAAAAAFVWRALTGTAAGRLPAKWRVDVRVPGGTLNVEVSARRNAGGRVSFGPAFLEGEARQLSTGAWGNPSARPAIRRGSLGMSPRSNGAGLHGRTRS